MGKFVIKRGDGKFYGMWGWAPNAHADGVMVFGSKADAEAEMRKQRIDGEAIAQPPKIEPGRAAAPKLFSNG